MGRFLECRKCNILVATQALVHYLICPHSRYCASSGIVRIYHTNIACVITYIYIYIEGGREGKRETERDRERETHTHTHIHTETKTETEKDSQRKLASIGLYTLQKTLQ